MQNQKFTRKQTMIKHTKKQFVSSLPRAAVGLLLYIALIGIDTFAQSSTSLAESRKNLILEALNAKPENWISPIKAEDIEMGQYEARIVVNKKSKFTYFLHIENSAEAQSKMILVPMSTSRYTPTYYQTDEWWDQHKDEIDQAKREGKPMPKQDMNEVQVWLEQMKLSTNPDVFIINPQAAVHFRTQKLQDYLLEVQLKHFVENGKVVLYRGAEKPKELESWKSGQVPRGVRYWTPTANYAWRYGRKNPEFLDLLLKDETPLFRFEIPVAQFKEMNQRRWPRLTFGTELTKNSHQIFDRSRYFGDHLYSGAPFLGWGEMAVEIEVRSNRSGAEQMVQYFKRPATIDDLVNDRIKVLKQAQARLEVQLPDQKDRFNQTFAKRIQRTQLEGAILTALKKGSPEAEIQALVQKLGSEQAELAYIDGTQFTSWALAKAKTARVMCREVLK
jgi:hypothetical protein